ncbi:MAG TPA: hypothetical protein VFB32_03375 [Rudaea sp.]|nr:hypothetical protein [Rudaea sp.]
MQRQMPCAATRSSDVLPLALWIWLLAGLAALAAFPELRSRDAWFGWLPFWLVVAPLIDLAILRRARLGSLARAAFARAARRRHRRRQARRVQRRRVLMPLRISRALSR